MEVVVEKSGANPGDGVMDGGGGGDERGKRYYNIHHMCTGNISLSITPSWQNKKINSKTHTSTIAKLF